MYEKDDKLRKIILDLIKSNGPIHLSEFMSICLYDSNYGYYKNSRVIGNKGDFITSPEISQVFGELVGLWLGQTWVDRGKPSPFSLIELGPGNGTMMLDVLNTTKKIPGFTESASIVLVESSQTLKAHQKSLLRDYNPIWIENVLGIPEQPLFLIANEFLDALPIRQFKKDNNIWHERYVALSNNGELHFIYVPSNFDHELNILYREVPDDITVETSDITKSILSDLSEKILRNGGVSLFIDYGYFNGFGETLRDQCLDELKDEQRIVLIMNSFEGFTSEKISSVLEKPRNSVLTWLTKAKREFADCILGKE